MYAYLLTFATTFGLGLGEYSDFQDYSYPRYNRQSPCVFCYANADPAPLTRISFERAVSSVVGAPLPID